MLHFNRIKKIQHNPKPKTKNPLISERAVYGVKWARTIDLYDVNVTL